MQDDLGPDTDILASYKGHDQEPPPTPPVQALGGSHQWCLEEPKSISAEHWPIICKGLSCPGLQEEKGPKSVTQSPLFGVDILPQGGGAVALGQGAVRRPHHTLEITLGRHLGHPGRRDTACLRRWAKGEEGDLTPPQQGVDPTSLRAQWQGHLQTVDGQTHLDSKTRSKCIRHVLIRGHQQLPDNPLKEWDLHLLLSPVSPQTLETSEKESDVYLVSTAHPGLHTLSSLHYADKAPEEIFYPHFTVN